MKKIRTPMWLKLITLVLTLQGPVSANAASIEDCVTKGILDSDGDTSLAQIRTQCESVHGNAMTTNEDRLLECLQLRGITAGDQSTVTELMEECRVLVSNGNRLPAKFIESRRTEASAYVISPLRQNYILPTTYNNDPNQAPYQLIGDDIIEKEEAKLQISLKVPLSFTDLLTANDGIYFGFTLKSFWQVYNGDVSAPFRETNYRPEIFYQAPLPIASSNGTWFGRLGFEHESNGRSQFLSRSWNRTYITLGFAAEDWAVAIQPWYRLPEDDKIDDGNPATPPPSDGDDNPDIEDYLGYFELTAAWQWQSLEFSSLLRRNFEEGRGAYELGVSFPLWGRLRGYAQYFDGYGESMIDYNHKNQRIGVGVLLTDLL